jgi:hypothetical protein
MGFVPCEACPELEARAEADCPAGDFHDFCVADVCATCDLGVWVNATKEAYEELVEVTDPIYDDIPTDTPAETPSSSPTSSYEEQISASCPMTAVNMCADFNAAWLSRVQNKTAVEGSNFLSADIEAVMETVDGGKWSRSEGSGWPLYYWDTVSGATQWDIPASLSAAAAMVAVDGGPCIAAISCCQNCFKCGEELTSQMAVDGEAKYVCTSNTDCGYFKGVYQCKCHEAALTACTAACAAHPALLPACDHCSQLMETLPQGKSFG